MRRIFAVVLLAWSCGASAQNLSPEVRDFVKVDAPVVALTHLRVIDGTGAAGRGMCVSSQRMPHSSTGRGIG